MLWLFDSFNVTLLLDIGSFSVCVCVCIQYVTDSLYNYTQPPVRKHISPVSDLLPKQAIELLVRLSDSPAGQPLLSQYCIFTLREFLIFYFFCSKQWFKVPVILYSWSQAGPLAEDMTLSYLLNYQVLPNIQIKEISLWYSYIKFLLWEKLARQYLCLYVCGEGQHRWLCHLVWENIFS